MATFVNGDKIQFSTGGGSVSISRSGNVTFTYGSISSSVNLTHLSGSTTLNAGVASITFSSDGTGKIGFKDGLVSGSLGFDSGLNINAADLNFGLGTPGKAAAGLDLALNFASGRWIGKADLGLQVPTSVNVPYFKDISIPGATWLNGKTNWEATFDPATQDPCAALKSVNASIGGICSTLEAGKAYGTINANEQRELDDLGLGSQSLSNYTDGQGDLLAFSSGAILFEEANGQGLSFSNGYNGTGVVFGSYDTTGNLTCAEIAGNGGYLQASDADFDLSGDVFSNLTLYGLDDKIDGENGDKATENRPSGGSAVVSWANGQVYESDFSGYNGTGINEGSDVLPDEPVGFLGDPDLPLKPTHQTIPMFRASPSGARRQHPAGSMPSTGGVHALVEALATFASHQAAAESLSSAPLPRLLQEVVLAASPA